MISADNKSSAQKNAKQSYNAITWNSARLPDLTVTGNIVDGLVGIVNDDCME